MNGAVAGDLKPKTSTSFALKRTATTRSKVKRIVQLSTGLQKWFQGLHKELFSKTDERKHSCVLSGVQNPAMCGTFESGFT